MKSRILLMTWRRSVWTVGRCLLEHTGLQDGQHCFYHAHPSSLENHTGKQKCQIIKFAMPEMCSNRLQFGTISHFPQGFRVVVLGQVSTDDAHHRRSTDLLLVVVLLRLPLLLLILSLLGAAEDLLDLIHNKRPVSLPILERLLLFPGPLRPPVLLLTSHP